MEKSKQNKKYVITTIVSVIIILILVISLTNISSQNKEAKAEISKLKSDTEEKDNEINKLEEKVEEAKPWFELSEKEREREIKKDEEKEKKEKLAAEKEKKEKEKKQAKKEEKERKKAEEKEKQGYDTDITYDELARTPDDFEAEKVKFHGKVVQVMEGDTTVQLRFAVDDNYDQMLYVEYDDEMIDSRVLEDDMITIMGVSQGIITYESTMGGNITIPAILVDKIEQ